jgi:hypothetical protein
MENEWQRPRVEIGNTMTSSCGGKRRRNQRGKITEKKGINK